MKVAEDRVIQSYFYQIDQDTLREVRFIPMLGKDVCVVMIRLFYSNTLKPLVSDHPKCQAMVVAYGV